MLVPQSSDRFRVLGASGLIFSRHGTFLLQPKSKNLVIESQYPANELVELVEKEDRHEAGESKQKDVEDVV